MRGFTLVELMIVVAIIGVLAALAIYGVTRYLASAKTSECKNTIGAISRGAQSAYEREQAAPELLADGATGTQLSHDLCGTSSYSIAAIPPGRKDQPAATTFETLAAGNTNNVGWKCLRFSITDPTYYRYAYWASRAGSALPTSDSIGGAAVPGPLGNPSGVAFEAFGEGDIDGDSTTSAFGIDGQVTTATHTIKVSTQLKIVNELE